MGSATVGSRAVGLFQRRKNALIALPVLIATVDVVLLVMKLRGIVSILYLSSDTASGPVIASLANASSIKRVVTLGNYPWYEALWFMRATIGLPAHRQIWEIAPIVWTALSYLVLVRVAWGLFGRWVALMTAAVVICVTPFQQIVFFTLDTHGALLVHACVLMGALTWLSTRRDPPPWAALVVLAVPLAVFTGAGVASDPLAFVAYVIPFVAAACLGAWRFGGATQQRVAVFAVATAAMAVVGGEIAAAVMRSEHWVGTPLKVSFVGLGHMFSNLDIFAKAFSNLGGGDFFGVPLAGASYTLVAGILTLLALALVLRWLCWRVPRLLARTPNASSRQAGAFVYVAFWAIALVGVCAVFLLSSVPQDSHSARYLANAYVAVAALLPLLGRNGGCAARVLLACGIGVFAACAIHGTVQQPSKPTTALLPVAPPVAGEIEHFALSHGATYGYARYWDAEALTWETHLRIEAYPAYNCVLPKPTICPFPLNNISSWYIARSHASTFLIVDSTPPDPLAADPASGTPTATAHFGDVTVYIYKGDIASAMGCGPSQVCDSK